jgi:hypothetical protein
MSSQLSPEAKPFIPSNEVIEVTTSQLNPEAKPFMPSNEVIQPTVDPALHPCVNCGKTCKGKQCKDCHLRMIQSNCSDCEKPFNARRKNGTMRKRCGSCQDDYNEKYIRTCPGCSKEFNNFGKNYQACLDCYKNRKENEKKEFERIKAEKEEKRQARREEFEKMDKKNCQSRGCKNMTPYKFCKPCNDDRKYLDNNYMTYTCGECNRRGRGNYTLCRDCSSN